MAEVYRLALLFVQVMDFKTRRGRVVDRHGVLLGDLYLLLHAIEAGNWPAGGEQ